MSDQDFTPAPSGSAIDFPQLTGDLEDAQDLFIGACLDLPTVVVSESGGVVSLGLENDGGGDLRFYFSDGVHTHDCTPIDTVALTAGTDTAPQENFIYILQSTKLLTVSTVGFPSGIEHAPIATTVIQSAASLATDGAYKVHAWTDHLSSASCGHLSHLNFWIRNRPASWTSGTLAVIADGVATFDVAVSSGEVLQLHPHAYPSFDTSSGSEVMVVNDSVTPYNRAGDLTGELTDASGGSMSGKYYNLVFWGVVSEDTGDCQLMVNLPTSSYNGSSDAQVDVDGTSVYSMPAAYRGAGFLIARITMRHQAGGGGTFTEQLNTDLRGLFPSTGAGGSPGGGATELVELTDVDTAASTANSFLATPDGSAGPYSGRAITLADVASFLEADQLLFGADGAGSALATGLQVSHMVAPYDMEITGVELAGPSGETGSIVIDLWVDSYANLPATIADTITAAAKPTITAANKSQDLVLTGWTVSLTKGDRIYWNIDSTSTFTGINGRLITKRV